MWNSVYIMATDTLTSRIHIAELSRKAALKLKNGSPKFRDVLRARCRARVKENRDRTVNNLRFRNSYKADLLVVLGNSEPSDIWSGRYESEGCALTKEEEEIIADYEALLTSEEEMFSEMLQKSLEEEVVCPVCQKTAMEIDSASPDGPCIVCHRCFIRISGQTSLQNFGLHIQSCVTDHSTVCPDVPQFHVVSEDDSTHIYMLCAHCSYLSVIA